MTSNDKTFDMSKLELLFREHFARSDKQFADMRADNAEFKVQMKDEFSNFKSEINSRFDAMQTKIEAIQNDITGLKHDVANLQHWNYWILAIILAVFVLPHFVTGIKSFFTVIREGIAGIMTLFKTKQ